MSVVVAGIPNLSQAMPFNLGELMNLSATRSTDSNNVITGLADSMLANLANNNAPTVSRKLCPPFDVSNS